MMKLGTGSLIHQQTDRPFLS